MVYNSNEPDTYWVGATVERFKVPSDIQISSNIANTPNYGNSGITLDFNWIITNFNTVNRFLFRGDKHHYLNISSADQHALIIVNENLLVSNIGESVLGTVSGMTKGIHYEILPLTNQGVNYNVYYFRDLTSLVFPVRQFQFDVSLTI